MVTVVVGAGTRLTAFVVASRDGTPYSRMRSDGNKNTDIKASVVGQFRCGTPVQSRGDGPAFFFARVPVGDR